MIRSLTIALTLSISPWGEAQALDRKTLDACEAQLSARYDECKRELTSQECNRRITTKLCVGVYWNETFGAFQNRRIEESGSPVTPFVSLTKLKRKYGVAGEK